MLFTISWRNIWRSRTRSLVVIGAITLGVWALIFMISFSTGLVRSYIQRAIENEISHLQVHHPDFLEDREIKYLMENQSEKLEKISQLEMVKAVTSRSLANGMIASSRGSRGVQVRAIDVALEQDVTKLDARVVEGTYFSGKRKNQLLVSTKIAEKLKLKIRSKVVITFQDKAGEITAAAFRVVGMYDSGNGLFDEVNVFVQKKDLDPLIGGGTDIAHEFAMLLHDPKDINTVQAQLKGIFPDLDIQTYREISPDVQLYESQINTSATIFIFIIMLALIFGIINTMLMAVLERYKELGMLMAIGMNKIRIFFMIVLETVLLALISVIPGLLLGFLTVQYFGKVGINLSAFSRGLNQFGMANIVYTSLDSNLYVQLAISVAITGILASIYPALKAIRLRPVEAIRKI